MHLYGKYYYEYYVLQYVYNSQEPEYTASLHGYRILFYCRVLIRSADSQKQDITLMQWSCNILHFD